MPTNDNALLFLTIYTKMNLWCRNRNKTDDLSTYRNHIWRFFGYIDVSDGFWQQNVLVTS